MPRKRRSAHAQGDAQICEPRINYASIKEDKKIHEPGSLNSAPEQNNARGQQFTDMDENQAQGQSLTSALVRSNAQEASADGQVCVMSKNGFINSPNLGEALGIALESGENSKCKIDYEKFRGFFDDQSVSDQDKDEMIRLLFYIGNAFYDAGFAYEIADSACGQLSDGEEISPGKGRDVLGSGKVTLKEEFNLCAAE